MTHPSVEAHLADPTVPVIESYTEAATESVFCDGCGAEGAKVLAEHAHFYPDGWTQLVITGCGDIVGRHYCPACSDVLTRALP